MVRWSVFVCFNIILLFCKFAHIFKFLLRYYTSSMYGRTLNYHVDIIYMKPFESFAFAADLSVPGEEVRYLHNWVMLLHFAAASTASITQTATHKLPLTAFPTQPSTHKLTPTAHLLHSASECLTASPH